MPAQITGIRFSLLLQETSFHLPDETIKYSNNFSLCLEVKIHYPHIHENKKQLWERSFISFTAESIHTFFS